MRRQLPAISLVLATTWLSACSDEQPVGAAPPNVVIVTFDTTRADHLGCYGYGPPTSPNLDRLAAEGLRFTRAYATSSWTLPTHASLFTGKLPASHGAQYDPEGPLDLGQGVRGPQGLANYRARPIGEGETTLAEMLSARGYATGAAIAGPWLKRVFGLSAGFDVYSEENFDQGAQGGELNGRPAHDVTRAAVQFVEAHADEPFFLFLNYFDPHGPWMTRAGFSDRFWPGPAPAQGTPEFERYQVAIYDSEIAYADREFGRLLDRLRELGLYENTWIVVTADHGELMGDGGMWGHGHSLSEAEIRVPLIVKEPGPGAARGVVDTPVQQVDVLPHLAERLGLELPAGVQGRPFDAGERTIVAEVYPLPALSQAFPEWQRRGSWRALVEGRFKFCWNSFGKHALYDLEADPGERVNLLESQPEQARALERELARFIEALPPPRALGEVGEVTPELRRQLEGTGYLGWDDGE